LDTIAAKARPSEARPILDLAPASGVQTPLVIWRIPRIAGMIINEVAHHPPIQSERRIAIIEKIKIMRKSFALSEKLARNSIKLIIPHLSKIGM
jgi:hypothetical protein